MPRNSTSASKKHFPTALEILVLRQLIKNQHFEGKTPGKNELVRAFGQNAYRLFNRKRFAGGSFQQSSFIEILKWVKFKPEVEEASLIAAFQKVCKWPSEEEAIVPACFPEALPKSWQEDLKAAKDKVLELHFGYEPKAKPEIPTVSQTTSSLDEGYSKWEVKRLRQLVGKWKIYVGNRHAMGSEKLFVIPAKIKEEANGDFIMHYTFLQDKYYEGKVRLTGIDNDEFRVTLHNKRTDHKIIMLGIIKSTDKKPSFLVHAQCRSDKSTTITYEELLVKSEDSALAKPKEVDFDKIEEEERLPSSLIYLLKGSYIDTPSDYRSFEAFKHRINGFATARRTDRKEMVNTPSGGEIPEGFKKEGGVEFLVYAFGRDDDHLKRATLSIKHKYGRLIAELETYQSKYENDYFTYNDGVLRLVFHKVGKSSSMLTFTLDMKKETAKIYTVGFLSIKNSTEMPLIGLDLLVRKDFAISEGVEGLEFESAKTEIVRRIQKEEVKNDFEKLIYSFLTIPEHQGKELVEIQGVEALKAEIVKAKRFRPEEYYKYKKHSLPEGLVGEYYFFYPKPTEPSVILCRRLVVKTRDVELQEEFSGAENEAKDIVFKGEGVQKEQSNHCSLFLKGTDENPIEIRFYIPNRMRKSKALSALVWAFSAKEHEPICLPAYLVRVPKGKSPSFESFKEKVDAHFEKFNTRLLALPEKN